MTDLSLAVYLLQGVKFPDVRFIEGQFFSRKPKSGWLPLKRVETENGERETRERGMRDGGRETGNIILKTVTSNSNTIYHFVIVKLCR